MNNQFYPPMPMPNYPNNNLNQRINMLEREIKRLEIRINNIEKNLIPIPFKEPVMTPLSNNSDYTNDNYFI